MSIAKKHYIFDLDDTLIDSHASNREYFVNVFEGLLNVNTPHVRKYLESLHDQSRGGSMQPQFEIAAKHFALDIDIGYLMKRNEDIQLNNAEKLKVFTSVNQLLAKLKQNNKIISICSNRQYSTLESILKHTGLNNHVENIISCSDLGHEKPDPFCLNEIMRRYNDPKESFVYFGDSKTDREFAEAAGVDFLIIDNYLNKNKFFKVLMQAFL